MTSPDVLCALEHLFERDLPAEATLASHIMNVGMAVLGGWLDFMVLEVFSNL